jgi:hypothetical protein
MGKDPAIGRGSESGSDDLMHGQIFVSFSVINSVAMIRNSMVNLASW